MNNLTLSEKYVLLAMNDNRKINFFKSLQNGIYVSALLELFNKGIINDYDSVNIGSELPSEYSEAKSLYDFVKEKQGKRLDKVLKSFVTSLHSKPRKKLREDVIDSVNKKVFGSDNNDEYNKIVEELTNKIEKQLVEIDDVESIILARLLVEFRIAKKFFGKDKLKQIKAFLKNENIFNDEMKAMMKVIDSLAVAGALAGAGAI